MILRPLGRTKWNVLVVGYFATTINRRVRVTTFSRTSHLVYARGGYKPPNRSASLRIVSRDAVRIGRRVRESSNYLFGSREPSDRCSELELPIGRVFRLGIVSIFLFFFYLKYCRYLARFSRSKWASNRKYELLRFFLRYSRPTIPSQIN